MKNFRMAYDDSGEGRPVILIHGFPLCRRMWKAQVEALVAAGYRVITPDLRGFGESEMTDGRYSMELFADDIVALMDHLEIEKAAIGGMSMGGYILLSLLDRHFNRLSAAIFIVTRSAGDNGEGKRKRTALAGEVRAGRSEIVPDTFENILFAPHTKDEKPALVAEVRGWMMRTDPKALIEGLTAMRDRMDYTPELGRFDLPAMVIGGELDICIPPEFSEDIAKGLPDSTLYIIKGAGHMANMEEPGIFNDYLLGFLGNRAT